MGQVLFGLLLVLSSFSLWAEEPLQPIPSLNVQRYMGSWYEIAKYPNFFQRKCASNTKAQYSAQDDGTVGVDNSCKKEDGGVIDAIGQARQISDANSAKLEVRFAPAWLSFLPFVWGNYWVIDIDPDYQLVAVSEPKRDYLWILARTPNVSAKAYDDLVARLGKRGFDLTKLEKSKQTKP
jgi:apolipoprotein D and lipocalin family protein